MLLELVVLHDAEDVLLTVDVDVDAIADPGFAAHTRDQDRTVLRSSQISPIGLEGPPFLCAAALHVNHTVSVRTDSVL